MLAQENPIVAEAAKTIYRVTAEDEARQLCILAERQLRTQKSYELMIEQSKAELAEIHEQLSEKEELLSEKDELLSEKDELLSEKDATIEALRAQLAEALKETK